MADTGAPPPPPPTTAGGPTLHSLVDLLNASAHDPKELWSEEDATDIDSEEESEEDASLTPSVDEHHEVDPFYGAHKHPHDYESTSDPAQDSTRPSPTPVRGASLLGSLGQRNTSKDSIAIREMALDRMEDMDAAVARSQLKGDGSPASDEDLKDPLDLDAGEDKVARLKTLTDEFGVWSDGSEVFVQSVPGALYRGVLIRGLIALTNRRLLIYAYIPTVDANRVIRSGPITVHLPGALTRKSRKWIELKRDSVTWYPSSDKLYEPLGACRMSQVKLIHPFNPEEPTMIRIERIDGIHRKLELDTVESQIAWRVDMEAALFAFRANSDKLRVSLPLALITRITSEPYMSLGEKVDVEFELGRCDEASDVDSLASSNEETPKSQNVQFGYLRTNHAFYEKLEQMIAEVKASGVVCGARPILEIGGELRDANVAEQKSVEQQDEKGLAADFVRTFALPDRPSDLYVTSGCELVRTMPLWGSLCITPQYFCFWCKGKLGVLSPSIKLRIPLADIDDIGPCRAFGFRIFGLAIQLHGAPDVRMDFSKKRVRDEVIQRLKDAVLVVKAAAVAVDDSITGKPFTTPPMMTPRLSEDTVSSTGSSQQHSMGTSTPATSVGALPSPSSSLSQPYIVKPLVEVWHAPHQTHLFGQKMDEDVKVPAGLPATALPKIIGSVGAKKLSGLHFVCLTIGSRGDVQPYIALGLELMKDGNRVTIASHPEYRSWVEGYGIGYKEVGGDPAALMKLSVEHKMFSPGFFRESLGHFRQWLDDLFEESWNACQDADILIESPSTMAGIHVGEALGIPYFRAFTMPWTPTSTYPQAFAAGADLGPTYNSLSYTFFDSIIWKATAGQVNRWRKNTLGLKATSLHKMSQRKTPFVYNFSSAVVPKPNDWKDYIYISGYWFLDVAGPWEPPEGLMAFIDKAREDGKAIIYVGFGSITVSDAPAMTRAVVQAVLNADVRVVLSKGWSERGATKVEEVPLPPEIFSVKSIAHDRLFPMIDAAFHHGGAGTTGASLRAGLPTLIHPFFGDQFFWATRVSKLGAGIRVNSLTEKDMTAAFKQAATDRVLKEKASAVGEKIRAENGPRAALRFIYDHIHLAQERGDLRAARARRDPTPKSNAASNVQEANQFWDRPGTSRTVSDGSAKGVRSASPAPAAGGGGKDCFVKTGLGKLTKRQTVPIVASPLTPPVEVVARSETMQSADTV